MVQLQMQGVQDVILLWTVTVNQTSHPVAMQISVAVATASWSNNTRTAD